MPTLNLPGLAGLLALLMLIVGWFLRKRYPVYTWDQWLRLLVFTTFCLLVTIFLHFGVGMKSNDAILAVTGFVILWYTLETYGLRWQMVQQNKLTGRQIELAVQPLVLATVEDRPLGVGTYGLRVVLRNIGRGPALFVRVDDFAVHEIEGTKIVLLSSIPPVDCIEPGKDAALPVEDVLKEEGKEVRRDAGTARLNYVAILHPQSARETYEITVRYEDIDRLGHWAKIQMGKGGIKLLDHGRETKKRRAEHA